MHVSNKMCLNIVVNRIDYFIGTAAGSLVSIRSRRCDGYLSSQRKAAIGSKQIGV